MPLEKKMPIDNQIKDIRKRIKKKVTSMESKRKESKSMEYIRSLLPDIKEYQKSGYTLEQIYDAIISEVNDIEITFNTFRIYLRRIRKQEEGVDKLPKGPVPKK